MMEEPRAETPFTPLHAMPDEETLLLMQLEERRRRHLEAAEPIVKRLVAIRSMQPPPIIMPLHKIEFTCHVVPREQADG
jgi:hypothetical protein